MADNSVTDAAGNVTTPYSGTDLQAAYKAIYGELPAGMMDARGNLLPAYQTTFPGAVLKTPTGEPINASQLMYMYRSSNPSAAAAAGAPAGALNTASSYLTPPDGSGGATQGNNTMATSSVLPDDGLTPEQRALAQMQQVDPNTERLRQQLSGSYLDPSQAANPTAADYQRYLDTYKQVDPEGFARQQGFGGSMDSYLKSIQDEYALGSRLDPVTQMQVEQQARKGQADRGNLYGSGQAAVEAMSTGQAGQALKQQRLQNLTGALGGQQSYLSSGLGMGNTAMQLYQQGLQNKANAQQGAMGYLGSGQTPYQAGASYLDRANANAATAAQGGPMYNPAALGAGQLGTAQQAPQYGLDIGAQSQSYFNSLNSAYGGGAGGSGKNKGLSAGIGAGTGALSGAAAGAPLAGATYGLSIPIGAVIGGALGGASGYYS